MDKEIETLRVVFPKSPLWYLKELIEFDEKFSPFFSHFLDDIKVASYELDWLMTKTFYNPIEVVDRPKALKDLIKLKKTLRWLAAFDDSYQLRLHMKYYSEKKDQLKVTASDELNARKVWEFLFDFSSLNKIAETSSNNHITSDVIIDQMLEDAKEVINTMPDKRNIKWEAAHAIDALRILWWRNTGKVAPYSLNPASPFVEYLSVAFSFLDIDADPISAFRRWEIEFKPQALELEKSTNKLEKKRRHPYDYLVKD